MTRKLTARLLSAGAILCCAALIPAPASANIIYDQSNTPLGTASASACSGIGYSPGATPGAAWVPVNGPTVCNYDTGANPGVSSSATGYVAPNAFPYVDSSTASSALGQIKLYGTHTGDTGYFLPQAYAQGGWNDSLTLNGSGIWVFPIAVGGSFNSSGPFGFAGAYLEVFQNGFDFEENGPIQAPAYDIFLSLNNTHNGCVGPSSWAPEIVGWGVSGTPGPSNCPATLAPSTVYFAIPVTAGVSFQFGIWASAVAGESSGGTISSTLPQDAATTDLAHTFLWGGPGYLIDSNGQTHTDFTITSLSGSNYNVAASDTTATPEPSTAALFALGVAAIGLARRRLA